MHLLFNCCGIEMVMSSSRFHGRIYFAVIPSRSMWRCLCHFDDTCSIYCMHALPSVSRHLVHILHGSVSADTCSIYSTAHCQQTPAPYTERHSVSRHLLHILNGTVSADTCSIYWTPQCQQTPAPSTARHSVSRHLLHIQNGTVSRYLLHIQHGPVSADTCSICSTAHRQ